MGEKRAAPKNKIVDLTHDTDEEYVDHIEDTDFVDDISEEPALPRRFEQNLSDEDYDKFIEKHVDLYDMDDSMRSFFEDYLKGLVRVGGPVEFRDLSDIEAPSGSLTTNTVFMLHWPPKQKGLKACGTIVENYISPSIKWVRNVFPEFNNSTVLDLVPKREFLYDPITRERQKIHNLYRQRDTFEEHLAFAETIINSLQCTTTEGNIFVFGSHVKAWFKEVFGSENSIDINGSKWHVHYIYHPEFIRRWATKQERLQTVARIMNIGRIHSVQVDTGFLLNFADKHIPNTQHAIDSLLEEEEERINIQITQEYIKSMTQATKAVKKRIRDQRKSPAMKKWWLLLEQNNLFWHNYQNGLADHYYENPEEGRRLQQTGKVGWLTKFCIRLSEIGNEEALKSFKHQIAAPMQRPESIAKMTATVRDNFAGQDYRKRVFGSEHVVDEENKVECSRCSRFYVGIIELKAHWRVYHKEHPFNETDDVVYHGDKEPQWACYGIDENGVQCTETKRDKQSMKQHLFKNHHIVHGESDHMSRVMVPRRLPKTFTHTLGGYSSALDSDKQNTGKRIIKLLKCWVPGCGNIGSSKAHIKSHFERKDHAIKDGIKWDVHEAERHTLDYALKFEQSEIRCYVDKCAKNYSTIAEFLKHYNLTHRELKLNLDLVIEIETAQPVSEDGIDPPTRSTTKRNADEVNMESQEVLPVLKKVRTPRFGACTECYRRGKIGCDMGTPCNHCKTAGTEDKCQKQPRDKTKTGEGFKLKQYTKVE